MGIGTLIHLIFGVCGSFAPNTAVFLTLRFFQSVGANFAFISGFVLGIEENLYFPSVFF